MTIYDERTCGLSFAPVRLQQLSTFALLISGYSTGVIMGSRKRKHAKRRGPSADIKRLAVLVADRCDSGFFTKVLDWCQRHRFAARFDPTSDLPKTRYVVLFKIRGVVGADGRDSLPELVHAAWVLFVSDPGPGLKRSLETILSPEDRADVDRWMESESRPGQVGPEPTEAAQFGQVSVDASDRVAVPLVATDAVIRTASDSLLVACGITPPARDPLDADNPIVAHAEVVGDALVERMMTGIFRADGGVYTTIAASHVLPLAQRSVLVQVEIVLAGGSATSDQSDCGVLDAEVRSIAIRWTGMSATAAEPLWRAVLAALERANYVRNWGEPKLSPRLVPEMLILATRQSKEYFGAIRELAEAEQSLADREDAMTAAHKRDERRWLDREADLVARLEAARASLDRERSEKRQAVLAGPQTADAAAESTAAAEAEARADELESRCALLQAKASDCAAQVDALRQALHAVELERDAAVAALGAAPTPAADAPHEPPATLAELGGWAHRALGDRVIVVPRALRVARKSNFCDPAMVYRVLEAMRDVYWTMRFDGGGKDRWARFLEEERLTCGPTGIGPDGRLSETYHASWDGRRVPLDLHLRGNSGRYETRQFRLYFHCDEAAQKVIIGHLPSHLPSEST